MCVCVCVCVCYWLCEGVIKKCGQIKCITSVKASSEGVSGFTFSVFDADCDSETIFMLSCVHRPLCLVLFLLTVLKHFVVSLTDTSMHPWIRSLRCSLQSCSILSESKQVTACLNLH